MEAKNKDNSVVQRYVDILTNGGFKALFGDVNNKDVVMSIINVFLPDHRKAVDIEYMPTEHQGPVTRTSKEYHYDFMCRDASGTVFIVELQRYYEDHWFKRCVSYASRVYDTQNRRGMDYDIPPVYLIGLMGVDIVHHDPVAWGDRYVSEYTFREKFTNELLDETIVIIFAELTRFHKQSSECISDQDKILFLLKNIGRMMEQPMWLQKEIYTRIFEACEIAGFTMDKRINYDRDMYDERRLEGERSAYRRIGLEEGRKEGLEEGRQEGRQEGLEEGRQDIIRKMSSAGMSIEQICSITEMSQDEVKSLLSE